MFNASNQKIWSGIIAKAWRDTEFKQQLKNNPKEVLTKAGFHIDEPNLEIEIKDGDDFEITFMFPHQSKNVKLNKDGSLYKIITTACQDKEYKKKLQKDASAACTQMGLELSPNLNIKFVEGNELKIVVSFPSQEKKGEVLAKEELEKIAAAGIRCCS